MKSTSPSVSEDGLKAADAGNLASRRTLVNCRLVEANSLTQLIKLCPIDATSTTTAHERKSLSYFRRSCVIAFEEEKRIIRGLKALELVIIWHSYIAHYGQIRRVRVPCCEHVAE